jgi:hypothetical protein
LTASLSPTSAPASPTSSAPAVGVGPNASFTAPVTDKDGYTFDVIVKLTTTSLGNTVEFDKPGVHERLLHAEPINDTR